jgi:hypothetical protein
MFNERTSDLTVLPIPFLICKFHPKALDQEQCTEIGESVDRRSRPRCRITVELRARAIDVAGMKKTRQSMIRLVQRSANEEGYMRGPDETMSCDYANDLYVAVGHTKSGWLCPSAEPGTARTNGPTLFSLLPVRADLLNFAL